ncbi:hypothetical protein KIPB_005615 [Kipferlia bialata]|uniref:Uncharacterized protein n=1 Tax=Kipferlia bialata TaxID=797122 RepID=A0A9K3CXN9_9EUKA|nr:hypothetical protein KIPB_005615 [Kipferlia bialata]|eukprot:g5615.t1
MPLTGAERAPSGQGSEGCMGTRHSPLMSLRCMALCAVVVLWAWFTLSLPALVVPDTYDNVAAQHVHDRANKMWRTHCAADPSITGPETLLSSLSPIAMPEPPRCPAVTPVCVPVATRPVAREGEGEGVCEHDTVSSGSLTAVLDRLNGETQATEARMSGMAKREVQAFRDTARQTRETEARAAAAAEREAAAIELETEAQRRLADARSRERTETGRQALQADIARWTAGMRTMAAATAAQERESRAEVQGMTRAIQDLHSEATDQLVLGRARAEVSATMLEAERAERERAAGVRAAHASQTAELRTRLEMERELIRAAMSTGLGQSQSVGETRPHSIGAHAAGPSDTSDTYLSGQTVSGVRATPMSAGHTMRQRPSGTSADAVAGTGTMDRAMRTTPGRGGETGETEGASKMRATAAYASRKRQRELKKQRHREAASQVRLSSTVKERGEVYVPASSVTRSGKATKGKGKSAVRKGKSSGRETGSESDTRTGARTQAEAVPSQSHAAPVPLMPSPTPTASPAHSLPPSPSPAASLPPSRSVSPMESESRGRRERQTLEMERERESQRRAASERQRELDRLRASEIVRERERARQDTRQMYTSQGQGQGLGLGQGLDQLYQTGREMQRETGYAPLDAGYGTGYGGAGVGETDNIQVTTTTTVEPPYASSYLQQSMPYHSARLGQTQDRHLLSTDRVPRDHLVPVYPAAPSLEAYEREREAAAQLERERREELERAREREEFGRSRTPPLLSNAASPIHDTSYRQPSPSPSATPLSRSESDSEPASQASGSHTPAALSATQLSVSPSPPVSPHGLPSVTPVLERGTTRHTPVAPEARLPTAASPHDSPHTKQMSMLNRLQQEAAHIMDQTREAKWGRR